MSLSEQFPVTITSDTKDLLTLYDHEGAVRARDVGPLTLQLPRGLYTLRTQYKEQINDQIIRIDRATTFKAETRNQNFTAAPIDAGAAHYEEAAVKLRTT